MIYNHVANNVTTNNFPTTMTPITILNSTHDKITPYFNIFQYKLTTIFTRQYPETLPWLMTIPLFNTTIANITNKNITPIIRKTLGNDIITTTKDTHTSFYRCK